MSSFTIGYFLGQVLGNGFVLFVFYAILETLIFKRIFDDPVKGKLTAAAAASAVMLFIALAATVRPGFEAMRIVSVLMASLLVSIYAWRRGLKVRARQADVGQTFE
ncbi:MAG: hypothetical protein ABL914_12770 [Novosphingobium sp.]|uniref:hypothetical protein n=1 Tax=Novosphingobium sp. TaxID=1874826 RepID=UPI0032BA57AF